ncbi:SAC3 domain-containing protein 1 [Calliopsis andreniformis]|uniref:SAC3 domain-containing protein 1 n=1 Tax=Calliopsis andreniformis TaxID=337506 RepID=UPI003FCD7746
MLAREKSQSFDQSCKMSEIIEGTCQSMCPEKERVMREREGLLHSFEIDDSTKKTRRPKADPRKTVKCFSRSAAGLVMTDPNQLRPAPVLLSTIEYLFKEIATRIDTDWLIIYDFIFDRLRSVRQDVVIQRIGIHASIQILEPIVRFLVYSAQRLCDRSTSEFNVKINNQHLFECITRLLILYDERDAAVIATGCSMTTEKESKLSRNNDHRQQIEAMYILLNMGDFESLRRAFGLPLYLKRSTQVQLSTKISLACYLNNYARVCSLIRRLSPLLICAAMIKIQSLRRTALKIMSSAYNSQALKYPGSKLQELLLYKDIDKVRADCETFGLTFTIDQNISFRKTDFKDEAQSTNSEAYYNHQSLHNFLPRILFGST